MSPVRFATRVSRSSGPVIGTVAASGERRPHKRGERAARPELAEQVVAVPLVGAHDRCQREDALAPTHRAAQLGRKQRGPLAGALMGEGVHVGDDGHGQGRKRSCFRAPFAAVAGRPP